MLTNDLKKGTRVRLRGTLWEAVLMDNRKGNTRLADVFGDFHEMGSVYSHDIIDYKDATGIWRPVIHTDAQHKLREAEMALRNR